MDNDKEANKTGVAGKRSSSKPGDSQKDGSVINSTTSKQDESHSNLIIDEDSFEKDNAINRPVIKQKALKISDERHLSSLNPKPDDRLPRSKRRSTVNESGSQPMKMIVNGGTLGPKK